MHRENRVADTLSAGKITRYQNRCQALPALPVTPRKHRQQQRRHGSNMGDVSHRTILSENAPPNETILRAA